MEKPTVNPDTRRAERKTTMLPEDKAYLDLDAALGRVRGNTAIYKRMLGLFTQSGEFEAFEGALAAKDYARAAEVAHGIKGMTGNLGFTRLFETSNELMLQLRQGPPDTALLAEYRETLTKTREVVAGVEAEL